MNIITIAGNATADAETRFLPDGKPVVSFSVADNKGRDKQAIFWRCSWFGERAQKVAEYIVKGGSLTVAGSIQEESWSDKDGIERRGFKVIVNDVGLQGGRQQSEQSTPRPAQRPAPRQEAPRQAAASGGSGFADMDDDIPFTDPMKSRAFSLSV